MSLESQILEISRRRAEVIHGAGAILTKAHDEKRDLIDSEKLEFERRHKEGKDLAEQVARLQTQLAEQRALADAMPDKRTAGHEDVVGSPVAAGNGEAEKQERRDFGAWLRRGMGGLAPEVRTRIEQRYAALSPEQRALAEGTGAQGGYTVPQGFEKDLVVATLAYGDFLEELDDFETTMGNVMPWPSANDTGQRAVVVAENNAVGNAGYDPAFGQVLFNSYLYSTQTVLVPVTLANDSAFDIESYLQKMFAIRFGRGLNADCTANTGATGCRGLLQDAPANVKTATDFAIAWTDLVALYHSVDPSYREKATWVFHDTTLQAIQQLTDTNGRPIFTPGGVTSDLSKPISDTILGRPYAINQAMPQIEPTASSSSGSSPYSGTSIVLFGDLSNYKLRRVKAVTMIRFNERYMDNLQYGYMAWQRFDGKLIDAGTHPVKALELP